jgi:signal peptidase II
MTLAVPVSRPALRQRLAPVLGVATVVVVIDQLTKWWALNHLDDGDIDLFWTLRLNLTFNEGSAFGQGDGLGPVIGIVSILVVLFLLRAAVGERSTLDRVGLGLLIGGATGNLLDRIFRADDGILSGAVVDFVDFQWWPVFNVADAAITVGIVGAVLQFGQRGHRPTGE